MVLPILLEIILHIRRHIFKILYFVDILMVWLLRLKNYRYIKIEYIVGLIISFSIKLVMLLSLLILLLHPLIERYFNGRYLQSIRQYQLILLFIRNQQRKCSNIPHLTI